MKFKVHEESRGKYLAQGLYDVKNKVFLYLNVFLISVIYVNFRYMFTSFRFQYK
jgi:hypothetical protein